MKRALTVTALLLLSCKPDLDTPRAYACKQDTDCVGTGWVCGLEGFCVLPSDPVARACRDDALCAVDAGWRCGVDERCYDRLDAGAVGCRRDAGVVGNSGGDCAPGWVCGLEGACHGQDDAEAWQCVADTDCALTWRCAATGACVDPSADELVTPAHDLAGVTKLNPLALSGTDPQRFSAFREDQEFFVTQLATTSPSGRVSVGYLTTEPDFSFAWRDGGFDVLPGEEVGISNDPNQTGTGVVYAGSRDAGLVRASFSRTDVSAVPVRLIAPTQSLERFVVGSNGYAVAIVDAGSFVVAFEGPSVPTPVALAPPPFFAPIVDALAINDSRTDGERVFIALGGGIFTWPPEAGSDSMGIPDWTGVGDVTVNSACGSSPGGGASTITALRYERDALSYRILRTRDVGPTEVTTDTIGLIDRTQPGGDGGSYCDQRAPALECEPCQAMETLEDFGAASLMPATLWSQCLTPFGTHTRYLLTPAASPPAFNCTHTEVRGGSTFVTDDPSVGLLYPVPPVTDEDFVRAGAGGRAWVGPHFTEERPLFFDRAPMAVIAIPDAGVIVAADQWLGAPLPGAGLATHLAPWGLTMSGVDGRPNWVIAADRRVYEIGPAFNVFPRAVVATDTSTLDGPVHSVIAPVIDGGVQLVVTANDGLYSAVPPASDQAMPVSLEKRLVVFAGNPVISLAPAQPQPAGASVYALVAGGLFRVDATGDSRWRASEIVLPSLDYLRVFTEGGRARIAASDGTVYALPSRVMLVGPLAGRTALDVAQVCGTVFALTQGDPNSPLELDRIEPGVGWVPQQTLDSDFTPGGTARLFVLGNVLFAATALGGTLVATVSGCPP